MADRQALLQEGTVSLTKPVLGLAVGGTLELLDGLSGFFEPSLAPVMGSVITFSLLKGLLARVVTGYVSRIRNAAIWQHRHIGHMHHAVYTFIDNPHFKTTWTFRKEQRMPSRKT